MMRGLGKKLKDVLTTEHEPREFFASPRASSVHESPLLPGNRASRPELAFDRAVRVPSVLTVDRDRRVDALMQLTREERATLRLALMHFTLIGQSTGRSATARLADDLLDSLRDTERELGET